MTKKQKRVLFRVLGATGIAALASLIPMSRWPEAAAFLAAYLLAGYDVLRKALHGIRSRQIFDENFLMAVATVGALALGEYREAVAVMVFYQIGELFQSYAVGKSRRSIAALMDIRPDHANLEREDGSVEQTDPGDVPLGAVILVKPGERVPLDGTVLEGASALDTAALTGESAPRDVQPGDELLSGCANLTGLLRGQVTKPYGESTVARILELVENSAMKKSRAEAFITRFARYYTPAVCAAALALAVLPPLALLLAGREAGWGIWIYRALSFLVISCPCALVISIPLSFFGGIGGASAQGILVKGSNDLEALAATATVVFDKTGTLTEGVFAVRQVLPAEGRCEEEVLSAAALAEQWSDHPISRSLREAWQGDPAAHMVENAHETAGRGVQATVDGHDILAGNRRLMEQHGLTPPEAPQGGAAVYVARDGAYLGCVLISDRIKAGAGEALRALKRSGVKKTVMLTGDGEAAALPVARELGVDQVFAGLLPQDKVERVEALLAEKGERETLAFVGDGVNDAPVLSRADLGVAMGAMGSDAAIEASDVVLMDDDPRKLSLAIAIARRTMRIVRQNIVFALAVKAACLVLTARGVTNMWWAIFADVGVMVLAVLNAARALYTKDLKQG